MTQLQDQMRKYSIDWHNHPKIFFVYWWVCFFYAALVAVFVQIIFLPHIAPSLHTGGGFMAELDCSTFHQFAVDLSYRIREHGWQEWRLDPGVGTGMAGIGAIFYTLFVPELWVMIPFNAFVHATSGLFIVLIAYQIFGDIKLSLISSIPFIISPSAALWYSQFHKDGLTFLGWFMVLYATVLVSAFSNNLSLKRRLFKITWLLFLGHFVFTTARSYHAEIFIGFFITITILISLILVVEYVKYGQIGKSQFLPFLVFIIVSVILANLQVISLQLLNLPNLFSNTASVDNISILKETVSGPEHAISNSVVDNTSITNTSKETGSGPESSLLTPDPTFLAFLEKKINILINKKHNAVSDIYFHRRAYIAAASDAKSNIDLDVNFYSLTDIISYVPRALQIGLFAPFPNKWLEKGRVPANTLMKRVAIFEMLIVYAGLIGIPFLFFGNNSIRKKGVIILIVGCITAMLPLVLVMTNVGIVYRVRYGFLMILVGAGFAGFVNYLLARKGYSPIHTD